MTTRARITEEQYHDERTVRFVDGQPDRTLVSIYDEPMPFGGTEQERLANRLSHSFDSWDPEETPRCMWCDAKSWHKAADYPCGASVPRIVTVRPIQ